MIPKSFHHLKPNTSTDTNTDHTPQPSTPIKHAGSVLDIWGYRRNGIDEGLERNRRTGLKKRRIGKE
jgi:hypothetical protein